MIQKFRQMKISFSYNSPSIEFYVEKREFVFGPDTNKNGTFRCRSPFKLQPFYLRAASHDFSSSL